MLLVFNNVRNIYICQAPSESENDLNTVTENDLFDDMNDDDLLDGAIGPDIPEVDQGEISENEFNARIDSIFNEDEPKGNLKKIFFPMLTRNLKEKYNPCKQP